MEGFSARLTRAAPPIRDAVGRPADREVMNTNHHLSKPVMIGKIDATGEFEVVWQSMNPIRAEAWSKYLPSSAKLTADWTFPWICGGCAEPTFKDW